MSLVSTGSTTGPDVPALVEGVRARRRADVSRAITLVESGRADHREAARELLAELAAPVDSPTVRVGISGVPGVGKSTFIETLGRQLTGSGSTVGVLAVDPSSVRTGGSVLGDKTRMARLAADPHAYIRPSPAAGTLGGVARATTQAMIVLEAAGYDVVLVETVGVGQSEVTVAGMVDTFLFLTLARTGDQLQGIKKGILEIADVIAVNKADGDRADEARSAAKELSGALRLVHRGSKGWVPPVLTCSGLEDTGVDDVWARVLEHRESLGEEGLEAKRAGQQLEFTWTLVRDELQQRLRRSAGVKELLDPGRPPQPLLELVAHQRPGELELLVGAFRLEALLPQRLPMLQHARPDVVDAGVLQARAGDTGATQPFEPRCTSRSAPDRSLAAARASSARSPSALFTAITSAISRMPFLIPCSWSPVRARVRNRNVSTIPATVTSDWPTPTVSTSTTS